MESAATEPRVSLPTYSFARERMTDALCEEILPLLVSHYNEIAYFKEIPLDPDLTQYLKMDELGLLRIFTAREHAGDLIGYCVFFVRENIHYRDSRQATLDLIYITPSKRGFGYELIAYCDRELRDEGVEVIYHHVPLANDYGKRLLSSQGYELIEHVYAKRFQ